MHLPAASIHFKERGLVPQSSQQPECLDDCDERAWLLLAVRIVQKEAGKRRSPIFHHANQCSAYQVRALDAEVGGIDILINNAAINPMKPIDGYDLAEWQNVQDINTTAAVALAQVTMPSMSVRAGVRSSTFARLR